MQCKRAEEAVPVTDQGVQRPEPGTQNQAPALAFCLTFGFSCLDSSLPPCTPCATVK
jgi:hypothetical protein